MNAADIMTRNVITIDPENTVADAARLMLDHRISGLPVCDAARRMVGMISEGDLIRRAEAGTERRKSWWLAALTGASSQAEHYVKAHGHRVRDVMSTTVISVDESTDLNEVVGLMERNRIKRVPVLRGDRLVGIISRANLMQVLVSVATEVAAGTPDDDATLRCRVLAELEGQPWAPAAGDNVVVRNGVVHLWGSVRTEVQRDAMRIAAETIAGVGKVVDHLDVSDPVAEGIAGL
jgi:CBS domain-containing protein